jgi:hypothetical protein
MKKQTIIRKLTAGAAILAAATGSVAAAAPANAADTFHIDNDPIVVGKSTANDFKAFTGDAYWTHNGSHIQGHVTGTFAGRGYLRIIWYLDGDGGTTSTDSVYTDGVQKSVSAYSPSSLDVTRVTITYEPNYGVNTSSLTRMSEVDYVGDSPDSMGVCGRLDSDNLAVSNSYASFSGKVTWACSFGHVFADVSGTMTPKAGAPDDSYLFVKFTYADGTTSTISGWDVTSGSAAVTESQWSDTTKQARRVDVFLAGSQATWPTQWVKFGDY